MRSQHPTDVLERENEAYRRFLDYRDRRRGGREMRQQLTGPHRDRMIEEGREQQRRYIALKRHRAEVLQTLRFFESLGKPLSTWERQVLSEAEENET